MRRIKDSLYQKFKMKDSCTLSWFLGIEFECMSDSIVIKQTNYVEKLLERFNMADCKLKRTPCDLASNKIKQSDSVELEDPKLYREIACSLIYVMTCTRPDICYAVTLLSQSMSKPTKAHMSMAKHVLRYLKGTMSYGLKFEKSIDKLELVGYSDSDRAGSEDRRSISGYCFQLSSNGPLISWKSRTQQCVALSSCEAE